MPVTYKIIGGQSAGKLIAPVSLGMQRPPDAMPIGASDKSPFADAARKEAQADRSYRLRPVTFSFEDGPPITVYPPQDYSDDDVLRELGLTLTQTVMRDRAIIEAAVEMYEKP